MDIDNLQAGRELDVLVAREVMGQTDFSHPGFFWTEQSNEEGDGWDGWQCPRCKLVVYGEQDNQQERAAPCTYSHSTEIAAAWQVIEKLYLRYGIDIRLRKNGSVLVTLDEWKDLTGFRDELFQSVSDSVPLAICRASLKAVASKEPMSQYDKTEP